MEQCEYCGHPLRFVDSRGHCVVQMGDPEDVARGKENRCGCPKHGAEGQRIRELAQARQQ